MTNNTVYDPVALCLTQNLQYLYRKRYRRYCHSMPTEWEHLGWWLGWWLGCNSTVNTASGNQIIGAMSDAESLGVIITQVITEICTVHTVHAVLYFRYLIWSDKDYKWVQSSTVSQGSLSRQKTLCHLNKYSCAMEITADFFKHLCFCHFILVWV